MKKIYNMLDKEISVPYLSMVELQKQNKINLSINKDTARNITLNASQFNSSASLSPIIKAQKLWTLIGSILLIYSIYASFAQNWWWFLVGLIVFGLIGNANTDANASNILDHVKLDPIFYDNISSFLVYEMDDSDAEQFKL